MIDALIVICTVIIILIATWTVYDIVEFNDHLTLKGRVKAEIRKLENELKYFEKLLLDARLKNLEEDDSGYYDRMVKKYSDDVKYYRIKINLLERLL